MVVNSLLFSLLPVGALLSSYVLDESPWTHIEANSEQRQPVYLGASPREMVLWNGQSRYPLISKDWLKIGELQAQAIQQFLEEESVELEAWPVRSVDNGERSWAFARWRQSQSSPWQWLDADSLVGLSQNLKTEPFFPAKFHSWVPSERSLIFDDLLMMGNLYDKPRFGDCVWTDLSGEKIVGAWHPISQMNEYQKRFGSTVSTGAVCRAIPQVARFNAQPISFVLKVNEDGVQWPDEILVVEESLKKFKKISIKSLITSWRGSKQPLSFEEAYRQDVLELAGETETAHPLGLAEEPYWKRKNCAQKDHQLEKLVDYLEGRYSALGFSEGNFDTLLSQATRSSRTRSYFRQRFDWRGIPQSNLIVVIPGSLPPTENRPILMADHIDTAFSEDAFNESWERVSAPGADDNVSAVAALLRAGAVLENFKPKHDIWLVHLTGEEYPADDLGARRLLSALLEARFDIGGLVLLDMVGVAAKGDRVFQINAGACDRSLDMAHLARAAAKIHASHLKPEIRTRYHAKSYLYNTDGVVFSDTGFPVILFNEHINAIENIGRPDYHETSDTSDKMDFPYAISIVKTAIETVAALAMQQK